MNALNMKIHLALSPGCVTTMWTRNLFIWIPMSSFVNLQALFVCKYNTTLLTYKLIDMFLHVLLPLFRFCEHQVTVVALHGRVVVGLQVLPQLEIVVEVDAANAALGLIVFLELVFV